MMEKEDAIALLKSLGYAIVAPKSKDDIIAELKAKIEHLETQLANRPLKRDINAPFYVPQKWFLDDSINRIIS